MTTTQTTDFVTITPQGIPHIGLKQIAAEYELSPAKAHRLMKKSGMEPYVWFGRHFFPTDAVRAYFEGIPLELKLK